MSFLPNRKWTTIMTVGSLAAFVCGCNAGSPRPLTFQVKDQEVPVVLMVGPFQTANIIYDGQPLTPDVEDALKATFQSSLKSAGVFKDVKILVAKRMVSGLENLASPLGNGVG